MADLHIPAERLTEVARIFAIGIARLRADTLAEANQRPDNLSDSSETALELPRETRLSVHGS